jgi:predicted alpha/beta-hydrolase family hydrolase
MQRWAARLAKLGTVKPIDYPYMLAGRRSPDRLPVLVRAHVEAILSARAGHDGKVILIGKSMGGRIGCHASLETPVDGLVCLGYPLVGQGSRAKVRDEVLRELRTPVLFVQGARDPLCPLHRLAAVRPTMTARNELHVVDSGDHSLESTKTSLAQRGMTRDGVETGILAVIEAFVRSL